MNLPEVTLELLKARFHYQEDYYNRLIKKNTGFTFSAYLQHLKIEKAKELLRVTSLSVHRITYVCDQKREARLHVQGCLCARQKRATDNSAALFTILAIWDKGPDQNHLIFLFLTARQCGALYTQPFPELLLTYRSWQKHLAIASKRLLGSLLLGSGSYDCFL